MTGTWKPPSLLEGAVYCKQYPDIPIYPMWACRSCRQIMGYGPAPAWQGNCLGGFDKYAPQGNCTCKGLSEPDLYYASIDQAIILHHDSRNIGVFVPKWYRFKRWIRNLFPKRTDTRSVCPHKKNGEVKR